MRHHVRVTLVACLLASVSRARAAEPKWISIFPSGNEAILRQEGAAIWTRQPDFIVGAAPDESIERLSLRGITPLAEYADSGQWMYLLHHKPGFTPPVIPEATIYVLGPETALYLFPPGTKTDLPRVKPNGAFQAIPRTPLPPIVPHPADLAAAAAPSMASAFNPLVAQILSATSQPSWFQFVRDLSGDNPVVIAGSTWTISTRYSDAMFPTPAANAHATEYLEDRGAGWGYTSHRETYTAADSGCGANQPHPWQNLIFIVPGQVDYGQHQQVLFVNHYDTISSNDANSRAYAPGADDAMSGGSALLEAMRTFKDYAFKNTLVFAFFSGEEVGICGSGAYVRMHPTVDMWRAVNMDQTAYDGDGNRLMDVYNWDTTNSPASVSLGDAFVEASGLYGDIIAPGNIVRSGSKMCQTDHCPFWDVGVGAIAVTEDLVHNDICPCFDQGQVGCADSVTQLWNGQLMFTQDYSWPSEKGAIAVVAQLAEPLYACPPAPVDPPVVTPGNKINDISWSAAAGVTNYVVERAATCAGPFTGIATVTGTSFEDTSLINGTTYAYRIRTCPTQVSACVTGAPVTGPSVVYQIGSAAIVNDTGDHDSIADNCELVTVQLNLVNDGNTPLSNVRLASVTSSNPAARIVSALPQLAGSLAVGATVPVAFKFYLGRVGVSATCGDVLSFSATASSDQSPPSVRTFTLTAERSTTSGPLSYGFETSSSPWTPVAGPDPWKAGTGAPGSAGGSLQFRTGVNNDCVGVQSPIIKPSATSTMSMWVNYQLENGSFDRANMRAVDTTTGAKTLLTPTGAVYNTTANVDLLCDNLGNLKGWSGSHAVWAQANFSLGAYAGKEIRLEVRESTDQGITGTQGFWMDLVQVTNATQINCDAQSESCAALPPEVSPDGDPVPLTIDKSGADLAVTFSESAGATTYNLYPGSLANLAQGIYDHALAAGLCGLVDGLVGDGSVTVTVPASTIPDNSYVLAVAESAAGESRYGMATSGAQIPLALASCP